MELLTKELRAKLWANGQLTARGEEHDFEPVVKFFNPTGGATWLFTELDDDGDTLFGLCDLGMGFPELGYESLRGIAARKVAFGLGIERDIHFKAKGSLSKYTTVAKHAGRIVEDI